MVLIGELLVRSPAPWSVQTTNNSHRWEGSTPNTLSLGFYLNIKNTFLFHQRIVFSIDPSRFHYQSQSQSHSPVSILDTGLEYPTVIIYFWKYFVVCYEIFLSLTHSCECFLQFTYWSLTLSTVRKLKLKLEVGVENINIIHNWHLNIRFEMLFRWSGLEPAHSVLV